MARKPPLRRSLLRGPFTAAKKAARLGEVEATDERAAIEAAAKDFKQEPAKLIIWEVYNVAAKKWLGTVEAADEEDAIERGAKEFGVIASS